MVRVYVDFLGVCRLNGDNENIEPVVVAWVSKCSCRYASFVVDVAKYERAQIRGEVRQKLPKDS